MRSNNTSQNIQNPVVPFTNGIKGFKRGARIEIHGTPIVGPNQFFCVELFSGQDIAFNLNARFYANDNVLALNSCQQGNWQFEERHANPLMIGSRFEIKITNKMSGFKIKINGQKINFSHRISAKSITMLGIRGDVQVTNVIMKKFDTSIVTYNSAPVVNAQGQSQPQPVIIIQQGENSDDRRQRRRRRMVFRALMGGVGHH
uniref:Galectin n=1 Tax=Acrobeloides nanus TaxID=290746 RepID=A0A914DZQ8_9BILA